MPCLKAALVGVVTGALLVIALVRVEFVRASPIPNCHTSVTYDRSETVCDNSVAVGWPGLLTAFAVGFVPVFVWFVRGRRRVAAP